MTSSLDESIAHLMEAYTRQGRILEQQREILEQLVTAQRDTSHAVEEARRAPVREHREEHEFERDEHVDTPEQRAVIAHYHQMRSQLGRRGAQFAVLVRFVDQETLSLAGAPTQTARSIEVDTLRTPVSAWQRDPHNHDLLTRSSRDFIGIATGKPVRLYAGPYLVGVGYWQDDIPPARKRK
jgi:translation elongation factor EF-Ts